MLFGLLSAIHTHTRVFWERSLFCSHLIMIEIRVRSFLPKHHNIPVVSFVCIQYLIYIVLWLVLCIYFYIIFVYLYLPEYACVRVSVQNLYIHNTRITMIIINNKGRVNKSFNFQQYGLIIRKFVFVVKWVFFNRKGKTR